MPNEPHELKRLTMDELRMLVHKAEKLPPAETIAAVTAITTETLATLSEYLGQSLTRPQIKYDLKGGVAGQAVGGDTVRLNLDLLLDERYQHDMLNQTLPHEIAHIVDAQVNTRSSHGYKWQRLMYALGKPADRCHQYDVSQYSKKRRKDNIVYCGCNPPEHPVTDTIYRRMVWEGKKYICRKCRQQLRKEQ